MKEPEIKLFGRKIVLPDKAGVVAAGDSSVQSTSESGGSDCGRCLEEAHDEKQLHAHEVNQ